jgi:hypothetical protein
VRFFDTSVEQPYVHEWNMIHTYNDFNRTVYGGFTGGLGLTGPLFNW